MKNLNNLYYFAKIVEYGSLSAASDALGIAKSVLSEHLTKLEKELGVRLLQRNTRRLQITEVGARYYERCRAVLDEVDRAARVIDEVRDAPRGKLCITSPVNFAQMLLSPVLTAFMAEHTEVEVVLDITNREVDLIAEGYDLALRIGAAVRSSNLVMRTFNLTQNILVSSPGLLERRGLPRTPGELRALPSVGGVLPAEKGGRHIWRLTNGYGVDETVQHFPRLITEDLCLSRDFILAGCGIGELPPLFCRDALEDGRLTRVLPDWSLPLLHLYASYPSRRGLTVAARTMLDYLSDHLRPWLDTAVNGTFTLRMEAREDVEAQKL